ncbi:MAG: hypothetical protein WBD86_01015 [Microgenomates group bacterium]
MKKALIIVTVAAFVVIVVLGALRLLVGGGEDTWLCVDGEWVRHGVPSAPKPESGCGEEKIIGGDKDEHGCIGSAGYTWCESKQKCLREWEEPCEQEEIFNLLKELEKETQIDFSGIVKTEFIWRVEGEKVGRVPKTEELTATGKSFDVEGISDEQYQRIETFLINNGFEIDIYNVTDGTFVGATGYKKSQTVCVVIGGASGYKEAIGQWIPPEPDKNDVEVKCGVLE